MIGRHQAFMSAGRVADASVNSKEMQVDKRTIIIDTDPGLDDAIAQILTSYERHDIEKFGLEGGPLHDPCAIGYLLDPSLFLGRQVNVMVEAESELTLGETVVDWNGVTGRPTNALWINEIDVERFYSLLTETVARLP